MTTAAASCITKAEERIGDMLAACSAFQSWVGESTAAAAENHIYYDAVPMEDYVEDSQLLAYNESIRPFALIWTGYQQGFTINEMIGASGVVYVRFEQSVPDAAANDWEEADRLFKNTLGQILQSGDTDSPGLWELSITRQYTQITQMRLEQLYRTNEDELATYGDAQAAEVSIAWGVTR